MRSRMHRAMVASKSYDEDLRDAPLPNFIPPRTPGRERAVTSMARLPRMGVLAAVLFQAAPAAAGEVQLELGATLRKSTWRGDFSGGGQLGVGYRFAHVIAVDAVGWEEPATVDRRLNTGLTLGVTGALPLPRFRPTLRLYVIHQHEEGLVSVMDHPLGTAFGIGAGIRHRAGGGLRLGVEIPVHGNEKKTVEWVVLTGLDATWFPDASLGPSLYTGVMGGIGINFGAAGLP